MGCGTKVEYYVPSGYDYKRVETTCGSTNYWGDEARCEICSQQRPWYICHHGVDISESGYCGQCELE